MPVSSLLPDSPIIQTLNYQTYKVAQGASLSNSIYPEYNSFVGLRLDLDALPIGMITVMNDTPMREDQINNVQKLLHAVQLRATNEIAKIRKRDNLIMIKNAALQDAESKIKFLADMSHEIRQVIKKKCGTPI